jgi:[ribosomal protein S5]-alanine N-acetyltransferase
MTLLPPDTQRLRFRPLTLEDVGHLQVIFSDPVAMRHWPALKSVAETREGIERCLASYARHGHGFWAVCLRETGEFVGRCGLLHQEIRAQPDKEIAYAFQLRFWGRGYATEAAKAVKEAVWQLFGFHYVVSFIGPENEPSIKVARRIGLELEEILPAEANKWNRAVHGVCATTGMISIGRARAVTRQPFGFSIEPAAPIPGTPFHARHSDDSKAIGLFQKNNGVGKIAAKKSSCGWIKSAESLRIGNRLRGTIVPSRDKNARRARGN